MMMNDIIITGTEIFKRNFNAKKKIIINVGGARSGKSYAIHQLFAYYLIKGKNLNLLICRKTFPALRLSNIAPMIELIKKYNLGQYWKFSKKDYALKVDSNICYFRSIDKIEKMKSTEFNYIFMEEANEMNYYDFQILKMRLSRYNPYGENKLYMAFNPVPCWIWKQIIHNPAMQNEIEIIKSNYKNNPFLSEDYQIMLKNLKYQDKNLYKIYTLGKYAELEEGKIYKNYEIVQEIDWNKMEDIIYGLDFGYQNPTALVKVGIKENNIYCQEILYENKLTNNDLINKLKFLEKYDIYADSAEPNRIEEIYRNGINIYPALKDIKYGIDLLKSKKIYILYTSQHLIDEITNYSWKTDKNGKYIEEPIKYNDHLLDALRYAVATYYSNNGKVQVWVL